MLVLFCAVIARMCSVYLFLWKAVLNINYLIKVTDIWLIIKG